MLELGAAAGLPSLTAASLGARHVVATDYPEVDIIGNLKENVNVNKHLHASSLNDHATHVGGITVLPHLWGSDPSSLLAAIPSSPTITNTDNKFTLLILADLLYNHSSHSALLKTLASTLSHTDPSACVLIFSTPYRPWLWDKDIAFLDLCRAENLVVEKIWEKPAGRVMFEEDRGDREMRGMVFGGAVRWKREGESGEPKDDGT